MNHALIAGASGIIGRYTLAHLSGLDDWSATGLARSRPDDMADASFVELDMLDPKPDGDALEVLERTTHLLYAAFVQPPGLSWADLSELNTKMFAGLMDVVDARMPNLKRVVLMQGQKYYGSHLGPFKTPTKEDDARHEPPNFYFTQQDMLFERSAAASWDGVCLRPHIVAGIAPKSPMNLVMQIGIYASLCKELGTPLNFPGKPSAMKTLQQANHAGLLANAAEWAMTEPRCGGEAFNITNGDNIRWEYLWPQIADVFGMEAGPAQSMSLVEYGKEHAGLWSTIAGREGLQEADLDKLADWHFSDYIFNIDWDIATSTIKARKFGFQDCRDTEDMMCELLRDLRKQKWIP
ncbi:MAG: SDR family oxidoreductase [Pseudomonadota bacterium]